MNEERQRSFHSVGPEVLASLYQHRLLSTPQIHALHMPDAKMRWAQQILAELADAGLVAAVNTRTAPPTKLRFLTEAGLSAVESAPRLEMRRVQVTPEGAAGSLQAHTLAVNDVGLAFVRAARERGDECGPLSWRHEIPHAIGPGGGRGAKGGDLVIADAVLRYTRFSADGNVSLVSRFIELDRATMPLEDLATKLRRYARLHNYVPEGEAAPGWQQLYPHAFPHVLVVLAGKDRKALERRRDTLLAVIGPDAQIQSASGMVISCVLLEDLMRWEYSGTGKNREPAAVLSPGPFGAVCLRHDNPSTFVDWIHG